MLRNVQRQRPADMGPASYQKIAYGDFPLQPRARQAGEHSGRYRQHMLQLAYLGDAGHVPRQATHAQLLAGVACITHVAEQQRQADAAALLHA